MDKKLKNRHNILVVDDSHLIYKQVSSWLERSNFNVDIANDRMQAIKKIDNDKFDVVIINLDSKNSFILS